MITRRRIIICLGAGAFAVPIASFAQQRGSIPTIGLLWIDEGVFPHHMSALREGLRAAGHVDGRNVRIEERFLVKRYEELPEAAAKLVRENVSVILTFGGTAAQVAAKATSSIPIIILTGSDPVRLGVATSFSRPGRNVTGISWAEHQTITKRVEILKEAAPGARRIGAVLAAGSSVEPLMLRNVEEAAQKLKIEVRPVEIRGLDELETVVSAAASKGVEGFIVIGSALMNAHRKRVVNAVSQTRIPAVYQASEYADDGGLMSYNANTTEIFRRSANYIDKVLKGIKPGEIPIEQPTKFELVVNLKTAKALGITIPQSVLVRADRVIE